MARNRRNDLVNRSQEEKVPSRDDWNSQVKDTSSSSPPPRELASSVDYLKMYEGPFTWFKVFPLKFNEIETGLATALDETFNKDKSEMDSLLKSSGMKLISKKATQVYFLTETRKFQQAGKNINACREFIETCLETKSLSEEYAEGFKYVLDGLFIYLQVLSGNFIHSSSSALPVPIQFSSLHAKSKLAIWVMRDFFIDDCRRAAVDRQDYMLKILEVEPSIIKWHFHLYVALRNTRKLKPRPLPYGHERIIVDDPLSLAYVSLYLAEILMLNSTDNETTEIQPPVSTYYHDDSNTLFPFSLGNLTFNSLQDILDTILEKTMYLLAMNCNLVQVYLILSEVHVYKIPLKFQKRDITLACLKRVLRLCPESPKGLFRLGMFLLKAGNHKEASIYLKKTVCMDNELSIGAAFALLQILMSDPMKNEVEIVSILKFVTGKTRLKMIEKVGSRYLSMFYYLKGCFLFMLDGNKEEEAISSWIFAHKTCPSSTTSRRSYHFLNLPFQAEKFNWPTTKLNLPNVSKALKHAAYIEQVHFKQILLEICFEVDDVIRKQWERNNSLSVQK